MSEKEKKPRKKAKASKKRLSGKVISPFNTTKQNYAVGDTFFTYDKESLKYLINKKMIQ